MIRLYHAPATRSLRILWLLEELGVPYEIKRYRRDPKSSLAPPELLKIRPTNFTGGSNGIPPAERVPIARPLLDCRSHLQT